MSSFIDLEKKGKEDSPKRDELGDSGRFIPDEDMLLWNIYLLSSKCGIQIKDLVKLPRDRNGKEFIPLRLHDGLIDMMIVEQKMINDSIGGESETKIGDGKGYNLKDSTKIKISV